MEMCCGWNKTPIRLSSTRKYHGHEILAKCKRQQGPYWLRVQGNQVIQVEGEICLLFACDVSAAYHDWVAYNALEDDGFAEDMAERESRIRDSMADELGASDEWSEETD